MDINTLFSILEGALGEAIEARDEQANCSPVGSEENATAEAVSAKYHRALDELEKLTESFVVIGYGEDGEPDPRVVRGRTVADALNAYRQEAPNIDVHGVYPGFMGFNALLEQPEGAEGEES